MDYPSVVGMFRALGFASVHEVAFGADLVALEYRRLVAQDAEKLWIATTCPAVVGYVERYYPDLAAALAPIVSPMVATARLLRQQHGPNLQVVFIGPCIAKKRETASPGLEGEVDEVLTFAELRKMVAAHGIDPHGVAPSEFDPPHSRGGGLFPISGGMLQVAGIQEDLVTGHVMVAEGPARVRPGDQGSRGGLIDTRLLEVLFCKGCMMGPGMSSDLPHFGRRARVSQYVRQRMATSNQADWEARIRRLRGREPRSGVRAAGHAAPDAVARGARAPARRTGQARPGQRVELRRLRLRSCREHAIAIYRGLAESEMCLPYTIEQLREHGVASSADPTRSWPTRRRRWCTRRSWPAWGSWPPASPTRSTTRSASC